MNTITVRPTFPSLLTLPFPEDYYYDCLPRSGNSPQLDHPLLLLLSPSQAILKTNKWRETYGVKDLGKSELVTRYADKARVLAHRDITGRPVIYIPAKNHNSAERDIDELTKFIVHCLVSRR